MEKVAREGPKGFSVELGNALQHVGDNEGASPDEDSVVFGSLLFGFFVCFDNTIVHAAFQSVFFCYSANSVAGIARFTLACVK